MTHNDMPKANSEIMASPRRDAEETIKRVLLKAYRYGQKYPLSENTNNLHA